MGETSSIPASDIPERGVGHVPCAPTGSLASARKGKETADGDVANQLPETVPGDDQEHKEKQSEINDCEALSMAKQVSLTISP